MSRSLDYSNRRGFSLLELVFGLAIAAILLGMVSISLKDSIKQEGPRALAYTVASDIKAARAEAKQSGKLVAYCLPSDGKTNSFAGTAVVRRGQQRGHILRTLGYDGGYTGYIFSGMWPGATRESHDLTVGWENSTDQEMAIFFRPDGTAFSPDVPSIDGNYPLVVGSRFEAVSGGPGGQLQAVENPHTIWVSQAGTVTVDEKMLPVGTLPVGGDQPTVASIDYLSRAPSPSAPEIIDIKFLPEKLVGLDSVGMGQNYVNVHADQKDTERLEYGIATMLIQARDLDGGPVYYRLEAFASRGKEGNFSVSDKTGTMNYVYDEDTHRYSWQALVSWRPPPAAVEDTEYELQVTVFDEEGRSDTTSSGAGLIPVISTLAPVRMVMAAQDGQLYLANLEGGSTIRLTDPGQAEHDPFFSLDGGRIYSFHDTPGGGQQFRVRNADGSRNYRILRNFSADVTRTLKYDPTYQYVAYIDPGSTRTYSYPFKVAVWIETDPDTGDGYWTLTNGGSSRTGQKLEVLHMLADEPPITITERRDPAQPFFWDARQKHVLVYTEHFEKEARADGEDPTRPGRSALGPYIHDPGWDEGTGAKRLVGFPPRREDASAANALRADNRSYNPASDKWFLYVEGGQLRLGDRTDETFSRVVHNGAIVGKPTWSSGGTHIAYVADLGGGSREVVSKQILNDDLEVTSFQTRFTYEARNLSHAQLAPTAKWVFFLENGELFRAVNAQGASKVNLTENLGKRLDSYVVAP